VRSVGVSFRETFNLHFPFIFQLCRTNETCPPEADYAEFVRMARNILAGEVFDVVGRNLTIQPGTLRGAPMSLNLPQLKSILGRIAPGIVLGALVFLAAAPRARADDWGDCNRRIAYAQWQLHEAIEDHGYDSRQVRHWRHELHEAYERQEHLRHRYRDEQWREREWRERRDYNREYYRRDWDDD